MGRQGVGVVEDGGDRQVLAAHGPVDDHLEALDRGEDVHGAPIAAGPIMIENQHQPASPARAVTGLSRQMPEVSPVPTPLKNSFIDAKRSF